MEALDPSARKRHSPAPLGGGGQERERCIKGKVRKRHEVLGESLDGVNARRDPEQVDFPHPHSTVG